MSEPSQQCPTCSAKLIDTSTNEGREWRCLSGGHVFTGSLPVIEQDGEQYPLITCLMPTKNRRQFIPLAIAQFLNQDYPNKELIAIADGESVSDLIPALPNVRHVVYGGTLGAKLNFGAQLARGEYIANWDDDDWYSPERLTLQLLHLRITGAELVGLSSLLFYRVGDSAAYEYHGPSWYAFGTSHFYSREFSLAHPHPDITPGEDERFAEEAHRLGLLSTISHMGIMVARNHDSNSCPRAFDNPDDREFLLSTDNWREVPLDRIAAIVPI